MTQKLDKIQHANERYLQTRGTVPCTEDLADAVGIGARETESLLRVQRQPLSIDGSDGKEGSRTLAEVVVDPRQECPSGRFDQSSLERRIDEMLGKLDIRERQVLRMRYGLQGEQPLSLGDIGKVLRVTKERIRQIQESAMSKLRQPQQPPSSSSFFNSPKRLMNAAAALKGCHDLCDPPAARARQGEGDIVDRRQRWKQINTRRLARSCCWEATLRFRSTSPGAFSTTQP